MMLNKLVDRLTKLKGDKLKIHSSPVELYHEHPLLEQKVDYLKSGILMFAAIGLHNIPEGMAIGSGSSHDVQLGLLLAVIIALHNIPEGMAIASPLVAGGMKHRTIILLTALSGAPTVIGGIIGALLGAISDTIIALSLSAAGGAMLYVVFGEIIPQSIIMIKNRLVTLSALFGIIIGLVMTQI
jgi:ZIP family zinc transporter